ncbi:MAG: hypothetical protein KIS94_09190 [Chitinophagales bacterium]|nr:hypothetical protein [Chitinophagales bacterium]
MKYYLLFLLFLIMAAGARTMFEIAYHGAGREHEFAPADDTTRLILLALWFVLMMIADVLLLNYRHIKYHTALTVALTLGVVVPAVYMFLTH